MKYKLHDTSFKNLMLIKEFSEEFFKIFLPEEIKHKIDLSTLFLFKDSFNNDILGELYSDFVCRFNLKNETEKYVYFLVEHQSHEKENMPLRYLSYIVSSMKDHRNKNNGKYPLVIPLLFYHGERTAYPYTLDIYEQIEHPELAKERLFKSAELIDLDKLFLDKSPMKKLSNIKIQHSIIWWQNIFLLMTFYRY